jgi:mono/diheme cytochrome c family protein
MTRISYVLSAAAAVISLFSSSSWSADDPQLRRGGVLMNGIVACANCHAVRDDKGQLVGDKGMAGGMKFDDGPFVAYAPNITPDRETGIGAWTDQQLAKAIREGIRPDATVIGAPMPIGLYRGISDDDLKAIITYLRAQPAVKNKVAKSDYKMPLPPNYGPPVGKVSAPPKSDLMRYGAYLAGPLGHCIECHTPMVNGRFDFANSTGAGGFVFKGPWGSSVARNLTPHDSGLKNWSDAEIARAIRTGVSRDGSRLKPPMAFPWYSNINNDDMKALTAYLRSLKPVPLGGEAK